MVSTRQYQVGQNDANRQRNRTDARTAETPPGAIRRCSEASGGCHGARNRAVEQFTVGEEHCIPTPARHRIRLPRSSKTRQRRPATWWDIRESERDEAAGPSSSTRGLPHFDRLRLILPLDLTGQDLSQCPDMGALRARGITKNTPTKNARSSTRRSRAPERLTAASPASILPRVAVVPARSTPMSLSPFSLRKPARAFSPCTNPPAEPTIPHREQFGQIPQSCGEGIDREIGNTPAEIGRMIRDSDLQTFATVESPDVG